MLKVLLEMLRFTVLFFILSTLLGMLTFWTLSISGLNTAHSDWIVMILVLSVLFTLYRIKGWYKAFDNQVLWISITAIILLVVIVPAFSPVSVNATRTAYSYGFPFHFLTLYIDDGSNFLIPNLFSSGYKGWSLSIGLLLNFIFFYFLTFLAIDHKRKQGKNDLNSVS